MRDHFIKKLCDLAGSNPRIVLVSGDLGFGVLNEFRSRFPSQFINAGIAEQNMTGLATGLALEGRIVFTYSIANFPTLRCLEQIRNDACYHQANVKIIAIGGGFSYGQLGISHHATEDLAIMRSLPDITVVSPCGYWETMEATEAILNHPGTCYMRLDKSAGKDEPVDPEERFTIGKARILQKGKDCTIIVTGGILEEVQQAVELLEKDKICATVVSLHTIKPFDKATIIKTCKDVKVVVTVEEHTIDGGLGGAVSETLLGHVQPESFLRLGLETGFSSIVGSQLFLRQRYCLNAESIYSRIKSHIQER